MKAKHKRITLKRILLFLGFLAALWLPASSSFCLQSPKEGSCFVYPSPAQGVLAWAVYNMPSRGAVKILIYNEAGDLVAQVLDTKGPGVQQTPLDLFYYRNGVYICKIRLTFDSGGGQTLKTFKFLVYR
jgi:hypothetical protein